MRTHSFGNAGAVPVIGQGTWYIEQADPRAAIGALRGGIDAGMTHIDTAEMYGAGAAEEVVGEAIAGRRENVFLVSKVLPQNASRAGTIAACEASLRRLGTDHLDCYLLHWRGRHPLEETFAAFEELKAAGKIRSWGVSNFDTDDLEDALAAAGENTIACNQVLYHLEERGIEHAVLPWCEAHNVAVVAYSPFGSGNFPALETPAGAVLARVAAAHDATPRQVALAFLTRRPSLFAIPKAASFSHAEENAEGGSLLLDASDIAAISEAFPPGRAGPLAML